MSNEEKIAHLGFLQNVITRMGTNSFLLKGWSVTLVAAIFVLSAKDANQRFIALAYFPVFLFWGLDAFFLHQEKLFRKLYEKVAANEISSSKFTMDTALVKAEVRGLFRVAFSKTLLPFHGLIVALVFYVMFSPWLPGG